MVNAWSGVPKNTENKKKGVVTRRAASTGPAETRRRDASSAFADAEEESGGTECGRRTWMCQQNT